MYDLDYRQYDPAIGRFNSIDLFSEFIEQIDKSPYAFAWNNPVYFNDPSGLCPECPDNASLNDIYNSDGGETYVYGEDGWTRQGGELPAVEVVSVVNNSTSNSDKGFVLTPKPITKTPKPVTTTPKPKTVSPKNPGIVGLLHLFALFYTPDSSPYSPTNQYETLNPENARGLKREESSILRVQFQQGTSNIASQTAINTSQSGVTTLQADVALIATRELARTQMKKVLLSQQAQLAFSKMAKKIQNAPSGGGIIAGTRTTLQETFIFDNKTYRIDVESIKGHNLKL